MISLILHFKNEMGEANGVEASLTEYLNFDRDGATGSVEQEGVILTVRKSWDRVAYFPNINSQIEFFDHEHIQLIRGIMVESDTHFPRHMWGFERRDQQFDICQELDKGKARLGAIIEDFDKIGDTISALSEMLEGFLTSIAIQNRVWQAKKILRSNDKRKIGKVLKKLRSIESIAAYEIKPAVWFEAEDDDAKDKD